MGVRAALTGFSTTQCVSRVFLVGVSRLIFRASTFLVLAV